MLKMLRDLFGNFKLLSLPYQSNEMKNTLLTLTLILVSITSYATAPTIISRDTLTHSTILVRTQTGVYVRTTSANIAQAIEDSHSYKSKLHEDKTVVFYYGKKEYDKIKQFIKNL